MNHEEFYIGYLEKAPAGIARFTRKTVLALLAGAAIVAVLLVFGQKAFYPSTFEFLQYQTFTGTFHSHPYPVLQTLHSETATPGGMPSYSNYYLVNEGKFGAQDLIDLYDGKRVTLEGALIYRDDQTMIEIKQGTLKLASEASATAGVPESEPVSLGEFKLVGEIVDSKCFLGVMNPGSTKPHRACATRCISGGIPPLFVATDQLGKTTYLLLQDANGQAVNNAVLDMIAETIEIEGEVLQVDDILILKADPMTYRRSNR